MSSENGLSPYNLILSENFQKTLKSLKKSYKSDRSRSKFVDCISGIVDDLSENPRTQKLNNFEEPLPKGLQIDNWHFRKLTFSMPEYTGAQGQGRVMYLVNDDQYLIALVWIYTHEQFKGRPDGKDIKSVIAHILESQV